MKYIYLEVSIRVEALDPSLLQAVSDLYGDSYILGAVCQEHVIFPFFQVIRYSHSGHSGFLHSVYMVHGHSSLSPLSSSIYLAYII